MTSKFRVSCISGYMAPEYIVRGKLTEKADVYSFGVLVMEVITGKRNNAFSQNSHSILQKVSPCTSSSINIQNYPHFSRILNQVWNLNGSGNMTEAVDPSIKGKFPQEGATRLLQIGLICVQANAELRPSMSMVVALLIGEGEIPRPTQPPFLNSSSAEFENPFSKEGTYFFRPHSSTQSSGNEITESIVEPR